MSKHTPGQFTVVEHSWDHTGIYGGGRRIALLSITDDATEDTQVDMELLMHADARLLGASPDLLAALQALFDNYKSLADSGDAGFWSLEDTEVGKQAMAAIAKATGEQP